VILQTYGYVYAGKQDYGKAIDAFTQCLALDALPQSATKGLLYGLTPLQVATGRYTQAVARLEQWLSLETRPTPEANALAGWVYAEVGNHDRAAAHLKKAIAEASAPSEAWYRQLLGVYFEAKRYREAAQLLEKMLERAPGRKDYWMQLSGTYQVLEDDRKALAVLELAYLRGLLSQERELLKLARYYLYQGMPYKAGRLLAERLAGGGVQPTLENWRLLSDAWVVAREPRLALEALEQGLGRTPAGELHLRRAHLAAELADWRLVVEAVALALATGGLESPGSAYLLSGIGHYHLQQHDEALAAFGRAQGFDASRAQAEQWSAQVAYDRDVLVGK